MLFFRKTFFFYLKEKFDSLDGCNGCFGDGGGDATSQKVLGERDRCLIHGAMFLMCLSDNQYNADFPRCPLRLWPAPTKWPIGKPRCGFIQAIARDTTREVHVTSDTILRRASSYTGCLLETIRPDTSLSEWIVSAYVSAFAILDVAFWTELNSILVVTIQSAAHETKKPHNN